MVGYFGVYGSLASLRTPQKCFSLVTDRSEEFLPRYRPLRSVAFDRSGIVVPHWGGLCRGRSFNDNMVKNPFNECLQSMHALLS